jgi:hypothetical protein
MGQTSASHDLLEGDAVESVAIEEAARALHNFLYDFFAMTWWIRHRSSCFLFIAAANYRSESILRSSKILS